MQRPRSSVPLAAIALVLGSCAGQEPPEEPGKLTVFAAASTAGVLQEAAGLFEERTGIRVALSFAASSTLARQIRAAAPADVFLSADRRWMDDAEAAGMIRPGTRRDLLANELLLIAPAGRGFQARTTPDFDFAARLPAIKRIAVGDPSHVPAGRYAAEALRALGWWDALRPRLVPAVDAVAAVRLVEMGEADAGIVYSTDARRCDKVEVVAAFASDLHEPIVYPVAQCTDAPAAARFIEFLLGSQMARVFEQAGFQAPPAARGREGGPSG